MSVEAEIDSLSDIVEAEEFEEDCETEISRVSMFKKSINFDFLNMANWDSKTLLRQNYRNKVYCFEIKFIFGFLLLKMKESNQ